MERLMQIRPQVPDKEYKERQAHEIADLLERINLHNLPYDITRNYEYLFPDLIEIIKLNGWFCYTFVPQDKRHMRHLLISRVPSLFHSESINPNNFVKI